MRHYWKYCESEAVNPVLNTPICQKRRGHLQFSAISFIMFLEMFHHYYSSCLFSRWGMSMINWLAVSDVGRWNPYVLCPPDQYLPRPASALWDSPDQNQNNFESCYSNMLQSMDELIIQGTSSFPHRIDKHDLAMITGRLSSKVQVGSVSCRIWRPVIVLLCHMSTTWKG